MNVQYDSLLAHVPSSAAILGDWPSLSDIEKELKLDPNSGELANVSLSALLIPSYANLTDGGYVVCYYHVPCHFVHHFIKHRWNIRFYGLAYKLPPNVSTSDLDSIINGLKTDNLNSTETGLLQNRTQDLASVPIPSVNLTAVVLGSQGGTGSSPIQLDTTDEVGEFDQFVTVPNLQGSSGGVKVLQTGILNVTGMFNEHDVNSICS